MKKLCVGCGTCVGICPRNAISYEFINGYATINFKESECIKCNLCVISCPIVSYITFKSGTQEVFGKTQNILKVFLGHSTDPKIRYYSASGGVVTSILIFLLEKGEIDGALVTKSKGKEFIPYIARNSKELKDTQGSIYFPTFAMKILRELKDSRGQYAVVGLPCQVDALKNLLNQGIIPKDRIKYFLGLRCFQTCAPWYLDYIIRCMLKLSNDEVYEVSARKYGWPGKILIKSKYGTYKIPHFYDKKLGIGLWNSLGVGHFNAQLGCLICTNHENFNADVTFADAWLPEVMEKDKIGTSLIIVRTVKGLDLVEKAESKGYIAIRSIKKHHYLRLVVDRFKKQRLILKDLFVQRSILKLIQKWGLSSVIVIIPYIAISSHVRDAMLNLIPPKILMKIIDQYLYITRELLKI